MGPHGHRKIQQSHRSLNWPAVNRVNGPKLRTQGWPGDKQLVSALSIFRVNCLARFTHCGTHLDAHIPVETCNLLDLEDLLDLWGKKTCNEKPARNNLQLDLLLWLLNVAKLLHWWRTWWTQTGCNTTDFHKAARKSPSSTLGASGCKHIPPQPPKNHPQASGSEPVALEVIIVVPLIFLTSNRNSRLRSFTTSDLVSEIQQIQLKLWRITFQRHQWFTLNLSSLGSSSLGWRPCHACGQPWLHRQRKELASSGIIWTMIPNTLASRKPVQDFYHLIFLTFIEIIESRLAFRLAFHLMFPLQGDLGALKAKEAFMDGSFLARGCTGLRCAPKNVPLDVAEID